MPKIVQNLQSDHQIILKELLKFEEALFKNGIDLKGIQRFIDFSNIFLKKHHRKEKNVLFPKIIELFPEADDDIQEALLAYKIMGHYVKDLQSSLKDQNYEEVKKCGRFISGLLKDRIYKEEGSIFALAEKILENKN